MKHLEIGNDYRLSGFGEMLSSDRPTVSHLTLYAPGQETIKVTIGREALTDLIQRLIDNNFVGTELTIQ